VNETHERISEERRSRYVQEEGKWEFIFPSWREIERASTLAYVELQRLVEALRQLRGMKKEMEGRKSVLALIFSHSLALQRVAPAP
jgi:hypothetical protein